MNILVIRTDRIGDLIVSTPVFKTLKESCPSAYVAAMVSPYAKELLVHNPYVDEIIVCDRQGEHAGFSGLMKLVRKVRAGRFDVAITLHSRFHLGLMAFLAGIPERIAPATKLAQIFYNHRVVQRRSKSIKHEADYNLELLSAMGIKKMQKEVGLWTDESSEKAAVEYIAAEGLADAVKEKRLICIHPGSGDSAKNWKPERYAELADMLITEGKYAVVLSGSRGEAELLSRVGGAMKNRPSIYISGSILNFASLLKRITVFVSSSTGPMHMAAAVKTPTVALFCPIRVCTPVRWGPVGNRQRILLPDVPQCEKCTREACEHYECMEKIAVDSVMNAVTELAGES